MYLLKKRLLFLEFCSVCVHNSNKIVLIVFAFFTQVTVSQNDIIAVSNPIIDATMRFDNQEFVLATENYLYVVNTETFKLTDSIAIKQFPDKTVQKIEFLNGNLDVVSAKYVAQTAYGLPPNRQPFLEYPQDTTYFYNIRNHQLLDLKLPGNAHIAFGSGNVNVVGMNDYFEYTDRSGNPMKGAKKGGFYVNPQKLEIGSNGIIKKMAISPDNQFLAVAYYNDLKEGIYQYTLELRQINDMSVLNSISFTNHPKDILFSPNGKYILVVKTSDDYRFSENENISIYSRDNLSLLKTIPENVTIGHYVEGNSIWKMTDGEITNQDFETEIISTKIWSNLTPFFNIQGFFKINENDLFIYGSNTSQINSNGIHGLYKYSLKDDAIYSKVETVASQDTIYNPEAISIQKNNFTNGYTRLNKSKRLMITGEGDKLQIWSVLDRKKLYDLKFENSVTAFLGADEKTCLIFEKYQGQGYNEFLVKVLNLETGIARVNLLKSDFFNPFTTNIFCFNTTNNTKNWWCIGGGESLIKLNTDDLTISKVLDLENKNYTNTTIHDFTVLPDNSTILIEHFNDNTNNIGRVSESEIKALTLETFSVGQEQVVKTQALTGLKTLFPFSNTQILEMDKQSVSINNLETNTQSQFIKLTDNHVESVVSHEKNSYVVLTKNDYKFSDSLEVHHYNSQTKKLERRFSLPYGSSNFIADKFGITYQYQSDIYTYLPNQEQTISWKSGETLFTQKDDISLNKNGYLLFKNEWLVDLKTLEVDKKLHSFNHAALLHNTDDLLQIDSKVYDVDRPYFQFKIAPIDALENDIWVSEKIYEKKDSNFSYTLKVSPNDTFAIAFDNAAYSNSGIMYVIDLEQQTVKKQKLDFPVQNVSFSNQDSQVLISSNPYGVSNTVKSLLFDTQTLDILYEFDKIIHQLDSDGNSYQTDYQDVLVTNINAEASNQPERYFARSFLKTVTYLPDKKVLIAGDDSGNLFFWKKDTKTPFKKLGLGTSEVLSFYRNNNKLFVLLKDSEIKIVDLNSYNLELNMSFFEKDESVSMAFVTPKGYFKASKKDIRNFHFVQNLSAFPILNYELFLNRPDAILRILGFADDTTIDVYKEAFLKRLQRHGFTENTNFLEVKRPELELLNKNNLPLVTETSTLKLQIKLSETATKIHIYANGVPILKKPVSNQILEETIKLHSGENAVTIVALNDNDVESNPETFTVTHANQDTDYSVHYIGIGVSEYQDSTMNLRYADKDVRSLTTFFRAKYKDQVVIDTLTNQMVTKKLIKELKEKLKKTTINDIVVVSFSGHGLVDDDFNFYFATHDIDFNNPKPNGLSYQDIQDLLSDIPARRKLLLLDACHSGELDETETLQKTKLTNENVSEFTPKGSIGIESKNSKQGLKTSFELMQSLFYDLDRGNGAYVISAAGGKEFAYESDDWKNGVFTYSFINGMYDLSYDTWKGKQQVPISKLKDYIYNSVKTLTNGQQKPTSRSENVEWDWSF